LGALDLLRSDHDREIGRGVEASAALG